MKRDTHNKNLNPSGRASVLILALILGLLLIVLFLINYKPYPIISDKPETDKVIAGAPILSIKDTLQPTQSDQAKNSMDKEIASYTEPFIIKAVKFIPPQPTVLDNVKAEVVTNYPRDDVSYEYRWRVNQRVIEDVKDKILPAGRFKKNDHISLIVTSIIEGKKGHPYVSGTVVIWNSVPSLDMKVMKDKQAIEEPIELQLISSDPDGDKITFSLEPPTLQGMSINSETGRIIWNPQKKEKGVYRFEASASDPDGGKITKYFEIEIK